MWRNTELDGDYRDWVEFLEQAELGQFVETLTSFGFGSADDLLGPGLLATDDGDLVKFCGMSPGGGAAFRDAVCVPSMSDEPHWGRGEVAGFWLSF